MDTQWPLNISYKTIQHRVFVDEPHSVKIHNSDRIFGGFETQQQNWGRTPRRPPSWQKKAHEIVR